MTIHLSFIEGRKGSVCNNDAYAVVDGTKLLDIIPASLFAEKGLTTTQVVEAFERAAQKTAGSASEKSPAELQKNYARKALGL